MKRKYDEVFYLIWDLFYYYYKNLPPEQKVLEKLIKKLIKLRKKVKDEQILNAIDNAIFILSKDWENAGEIFDTLLLISNSGIEINTNKIEVLSNLMDALRILLIDKQQI